MTLFGQAPNSDMYAPQGYSVIPPSPEVASLMKHNEYPVSYFTGQPQINLPIYVVRQVSFFLRSSLVAVCIKAGNFVILQFKTKKPNASK